MGSLLALNRRMNNLDNHIRETLGIIQDSDQDIASILQRFISSGHIRLRTSSSLYEYQDDSDDDEIFDMPGVMKSEKSIYVENHPDISHINESDICLSIKLNSGSFNQKKVQDDNQSTSIFKLLEMRQIGMNNRCQFSRGDKCQISQRFLPNKMQLVDGHSCKVFCGTFAQDGNIFMTASQDFCIRLYDSQSSIFKLSKVVEARDVGWSVLDTAVSPDGRYFIYCSWSESIYICSVFGDNDVHQALPLCPDERRFCVFALRFSQDGNEILGGANDECIYVYNREENQRTLKIHAHEDDVNSVAFADNTSQILFSGGDDGLCKVWDRRMLSEWDPKPVGLLVGHEDGITYIDPKGDGRYLITNSKDQTIKLWDMRKFSPRSSLEMSRLAVRSHNWDYRWQTVPSNLKKPKKRLIGDTSLMTYCGHSVRQTLIRCHFSPEATTAQQYIYTGCSEGRVVIYDVLTGKIKKTLSGHKSCVRDVSWHPYRNELISSSWDGTISKWTYHGKTALDSDDESESLCNHHDDYSRPKPRRSERLAHRSQLL